MSNCGWYVIQLFDVSRAVQIEATYITTTTYTHSTFLSNEYEFISTETFLVPNINPMLPLVQRTGPVYID